MSLLTPGLSEPGSLLEMCHQGHQHWGEAVIASTPVCQALVTYPSLRQGALGATVSPAGLQGRVSPDTDGAPVLVISHTVLRAASPYMSPNCPSGPTVEV